MRESLPITSTVLRRPEPTKPKFNLMKTDLETTCIRGHEAVYKRSLEEADFINVNDDPMVVTNRRVPEVTAESPVVQAEQSVQRRSVRVAKRADRYTAEDKQQKIKTKHDVVPSYFNSSGTIKKGDHEKNILSIMNKGTFKEISMLPTIGHKTAYQIMSSRVVNGRYETLKDLKKLPALRNGKAWDKFMEVKA